MRMPILVRSRVMFGLAVLSLGVVGCSGTYWQDLANVSTVRADSASPGKITWTLKRDEVSGDVTSSSCVYVNPSISLMLDANSAPVNYTTAQADFFYTEGITNDANKLVTNPLDKIAPQYFPFATQIRTIDRKSDPTVQTIVMNGLIPPALIDLTDPMKAGYEPLTAVVATVTLKGTNGFGNPITTKVNVPINIDYK